MERSINPLYRLLRWIARHVHGFHAAVGAFLLIGLGIAAVGLFLLGLLTRLVSSGATQSVDDRILLWLNEHSHPRLDLLALEITALGGAFTATVVAVVATAFLWVSRHHYSAILLWVAIAGSWILNRALKAGYDRPRPNLFEWRVPHAGESSFPSGHSMTAMVMYATLAYLVVRLEPTRTMRRVTLAFALAVVLLIGLTRMYLGVHYPSDVLAGYLAGLVWATFAALGIEAARHFSARNPEASRQEADLEKGIAPITDAMEAHPDPEDGRSGSEERNGADGSRGEGS